jgi:hypothetical protein
MLLRFIRTSSSETHLNGCTQPANARIPEPLLCP